MIVSRFCRIGALGLLISLADGCNIPNSGGGSDAGVTAPTLTAVTPDQAAMKGGAQITIIGTGFQPGATVRFGGVSAANVQMLSTTQLVATAPAYNGPLGPVELVVQNPDGGKVSASDLFSYLRVQVAFAPTLTRTAGNQPAAIASADA